MKVLQKFTIVFILFIFIAIPFLSTPVYALTDKQTITIPEWEMKWEEDAESSILDARLYDKESQWRNNYYGNPLEKKPEDIHQGWLRFVLPKWDLARPSLLISELFAKNVTIYIDQQIIYEKKINYPYDKHEILIPLQHDDAGKSVYLKLETDYDRLGLQGQLTIGEYQYMNKGHLKNGLLDVILGVSLILIALGMLISALFINRSYLIGWNSLCGIIFFVGIMILTFSPFMHTFFTELGFFAYYSFDISSTLLMPTVFIFFEKIFGRGPYGIISSFRKLQITLAIIIILWLFISFSSSFIYDAYVMIVPYIFIASIVIGNSLLIFVLIIHCTKANKEAIIITSGFSLFVGVSVGEVIWFLISGRAYQMSIWKWGILFFLASLVVILARRIMKNYEQALKYSTQLELFNNELQRSEKMEVISQLAASVAHEVRNPLQVTRGFLQLLGQKTTNDKDKSYMVLAIDELDRASDIITDFLTFAKPQIEQTTVLNIADELQQIEGILVPLATMQGGIIKADLSQNLFVNGNSSKFKQALINIIKNSIEALKDEGLIRIHAYEDQDSKDVVIRIKDNGEGMNESDLKRLGEPYYSKKSKGTGLGLMVTYRIIEAMNGKIVYTSTKGVGTEVLIQLPASTQK